MNSVRSGWFFAIGAIESGDLGDGLLGQIVADDTATVWAKGPGSPIAGSSHWLSLVPRFQVAVGVVWNDGHFFRAGSRGRVGNTRYGFFWKKRRKIIVAASLADGGRRGSSGPNRHGHGAIDRDWVGRTEVVADVDEIGAIGDTIGRLGIS